MKEFEMKNGNKMPALGLGTSGLKGKECTRVVKEALELGYRQIDTADMYQNHRAIAEALNESDVNREDLFITSKIQSKDLEYKQLKITAARLLDELDLEYFDLLLIHWPSPEVKELLDFAFKNDIILTAYAPLAQGEVFENSVLKSLGEKYDKTPAQLALRWLIEKNIVAIPKASSEAHLKNNLEIFDWDFPIDAAREMELLDQNNRLIDPGYPNFD
ncbi:MAG: aldo/keto reductase [Halanaerobium sp.]|nr:MAG: aldo/keto reductase [Halanaerobium sp.]